MVRLLYVYIYMLENARLRHPSPQGRPSPPHYGACPREAGGAGLPPCSGPRTASSWRPPPAGGRRTSAKTPSDNGPGARSEPLETNDTEHNGLDRNDVTNGVEVESDTLPGVIPSLLASREPKNQEATEYSHLGHEPYA